MHELRRGMAASGNELGALALPGGPGVLLATQAYADPLGPVMTDEKASIFLIIIKNMPLPLPVPDFSAWTAVFTQYYSCCWLTACNKAEDTVFEHGVLHLVTCCQPTVEHADSSTLYLLHCSLVPVSL